MRNPNPGAAHRFRASLVKKLLALVSLVALLGSPAAGFDTFWHIQAIRKAGDEYGFSEDARKIMQLGNFSPDFFGPVSDYAAQHLQDKQKKTLASFGQQNLQVRRAAIFLHFDNLNSEVKSNSQLDYLFSHLLHNTQALLADFNKRPGLDDRTRKILVLITLGASLHTVQDFYSHSDWIHVDFDKTAIKMKREEAALYRAPTWFEFRGKSGDPGNWPFTVKTGLYPPAAGVPDTHTHMNHDNSRLQYREEETPGQPLRSQAEYHKVGPLPAREQDEASALAHQQLAVNTATAASIEWVRKVEENADAKAAIEQAKTWNLKTDNPKLAKELEAGMAAQIALSCAAGKWDGEDPPADRGVLCKSSLGGKLAGINAGSGAQIESAIIGLAAGIALPWAMKFTGKFWDVYGQYQLLEHLTNDIGSESGHYKLR